ncbi:MAG: ribosomal-protein-alanine N-acetyltransferase [Ruminococcaceae bacterium]|nr:ribosomal-protein-alanine N-acetyltransferase [Oscillospiraceae bacterium]
MDIKVSLAEETDFKTISQIEKECFKEDFWSVDDIISTYKVGNCVIYVAKLGKTIVGYAIITYVCDEVEILRICSVERYRQKGIASKIFDEIFDYCKKHFILYINLDVRVGNEAAVKLYQKLGFDIVGERKGYYTKYNNENAYLMTKKLLRG